MPLEDKENDFQVVTDEPEPDFEDLAAAALDNAGIDTADRLSAARVAAETASAAPIQPQDGPRLIKAEPNEMFYETRAYCPGQSQIHPASQLPHLPTEIRPPPPLPDDIEHDLAGV